MSDAPRELDIRVSAASQVGFVIWEAGVAVAALTSAAELGEWVERRARAVFGEVEREAADEEDTRQTLPRIVASTEKARSRWRAS
jgi:hypothetical protein